MDIGAETPRLLTQHAHIQATSLAGSRAAGTAHDFSDWDFVMEADDFDAVAQDLPRLVEPLRPIAQQWDRYADHACFMLMLAGAVKVDLIFPAQPQAWESAWQPSGDNLEAIDRHFWDWIVYVEQKRTGGRHEQVAILLHDMHTLMLKPMGVAEPPTSISEAVESYTTARHHLERRYEVTVSRDLDDQVRPIVTARQPARQPVR
jgi:hypothetical protein